MSIDFNRDIIATTSIKKNFGTTHGFSMIAITVLDPESTNLNIDMKFENSYELEKAVDHIFGAWKKYKPIRSFVRSYKLDNQFQEEYAGYKLKLESPFPATQDHFYYEKNKLQDAIIDIEKDKYKYTIKIYKWRELHPRVLCFDLTEDALVPTEEAKS
jgi:hypothetical protein